MNLTFNFALDIVSYTETLETLKKYNLSNQLFRSGTSIGANVHESQNAGSKSDFVHKLKICGKSKNYPDCKHLVAQIRSINKVLGKIISTAKNHSKSTSN